MSESKVLNALNIKDASKYLSFLKGEKILPKKAKIKNLNILFSKIN
jgi:hypothetical protein